MSYARSLLAVLGASFLFACGGAPDAGETGESSQAATSEATVVFHANYTTEVRGSLERGKRLKVLYAVDRATCRATQGGQPQFSVTAFYRWDGGEIRSVQVAGLRSDPSAPEPGIDLDRTGDLEMWFENVDRYGCHSYDSDFGKNYHFRVLPSANEPGWVGNASYVIERQTCNAGACPGSWRPLENGFLYETYARQRAAIRQVGFEVWKQGVTDFDNADLWKQLDVQVHRRFVGETAFAHEYVSFDARWGNNAHYALDLRGVDPFGAYRVYTKREDCPKFKLTVDASGQYVEAEVEMYFTVNGKELRPSGPASTYHGKFQTYRNELAVCLAP